jgi:adenylate kinase
MLNIVLFGPPGAGKGTQSEKLISEFQLVHLSTGDILRAEVAAGTELGAEAKKLMDEGILVPDEIVIGMISSKLDQNKNAKGFIFDGFPRTVNQAKALDKLLSDKNTSITKMISLKVTDEVLTERLLLRGKETGRPDDQNEEIIRTRVEEYFTKTAPVEDYYASQDKFEAIDGIGSINEIFYAISNVIKTAEKELADDREEELVDSEGETHKQSQESFVSKVTHIAKVVKDVVSSKLHDVLHPEGSNGTAKASAEKLAKKALKKVVKKIAKVTEELASKPAAKKVAKKAPAKKAAPKKAAKKATPKKAAKKVVKKAAPKKSVKKVVKKAAKKVAPKKAAPKKVTKKAAPKKSAKKVAKKVTKKVVKKVTAKKATAKKVTKKAAKKATKKSAPKKGAKKIVKKAAPKKASKKAAPKKASSAKATAAKAAKKGAAKKVVKTAAKKGKVRRR